MFNETNDENICIICLEDMLTENKIKLGCTHYFHKNCILEN